MLKSASLRGPGPQDKRFQIKLFTKPQMFSAKECFKQPMWTVEEDLNLSISETLNGCFSVLLTVQINGFRQSRVVV